MTSARLQVSVNGGAQQTGKVIVTGAQTAQLSGVNTSGWSSAIWEIYYYPVGFNPGGSWALGADGYTWTVTGTASPPSFSVGAAWGKFMLRLRVNGNPLAKNPDGSPNQSFVVGLTDETTILEMVAPSGLHDLAYLEANQASSLGWTGPHQANLRIIDALAVAVGVGGGSLTPLRKTAAYVMTDTDVPDVLADTSGGTFPITFPPNPTDGKRVRFKDNHSGGSWGAHPLTLTGNAGQKVENPNALGSWSAAAGSQSASVNGGALEFEWAATETAWLVR